MTIEINSYSVLLEWMPIIENGHTDDWLVDDLDELGWRKEKLNNSISL